MWVKLTVQPSPVGDWARKPTLTGNRQRGHCVTLGNCRDLRHPPGGVLLAQPRLDPLVS